MDASSANPSATPIQSHTTMMIASSTIPSEYPAGSQVIFNNGQSASTFTKFPDLPLEIQDLIWTLALPGPRTIKVAIKGLGCHSQLEIEFLHEEKNPAVFYACRESRRVALKAMPNQLAPRAANPIFYNNDKDIIEVTDVCCVHQEDYAKVLGGVKRVIFHHRLGRNRPPLFSRAIRECQSVTLVLSKEESYGKVFAKMTVTRTEKCVNPNVLVEASVGEQSEFHLKYGAIGKALINQTIRLVRALRELVNAEGPRTIVVQHQCGDLSHSWTISVDGKEPEEQH